MTDAFPSTRAEMKALAITVSAAFLTEAGREGQWLLVAGTPPVADPQEGVIVISSNTGYYWRRVFDGLAVSSKWFGNDWQAAIDYAALSGVPTVNVSGTMTLTSLTGALKMRPGVIVYNFAGDAILTQGAAVNLATLVDFVAYNATGAKLIGVIVDGNRANNTDEPPLTIAKQLVLIYDVYDAVLQKCTLKNGTGNGVLVRNAARTIIDSCYLTNVFGIPIAVVATVKLNYYHKIIDNVIDGDWGQDAIVVRYANHSVVKRNRITGIQGSSGTFTINIAFGNTVTSLSGNYFTPASKGKFLIYGGGIEALIVNYVSPTVVVIAGSTGSVASATAVWGNGDVISIQGSDDCDIAENDVTGSASLGISIFSDTTNQANRNRIYKNRVAAHGSAGISVQATTPNNVLATEIEGNMVIDCGLNHGAGDPTYNVGISVQGGALTQRVTVMGCNIEGYLTPPSMNYGIAFGSTVGSKFYSGCWIAGCVSNTVQNP